MQTTRYELFEAYGIDPREPSIERRARANAAYALWREEPSAVGANDRLIEGSLGVVVAAVLDRQLEPAIAASGLEFEDVVSELSMIVVDLAMSHDANRSQWSTRLGDVMRLRVIDVCRESRSAFGCARWFRSQGEVPGRFEGCSLSLNEIGLNDKGRNQKEIGESIADYRLDPIGMAIEFSDELDLEMNLVDERTRYVLEVAYGLGYRLSDTADILGISESRACQLASKGVNKIRALRGIGPNRVSSGNPRQRTPIHPALVAEGVRIRYAQREVNRDAYRKSMEGRPENVARLAIYLERRLAQKRATKATAHLENSMQEAP